MSEARIPNHAIDDLFTKRWSPRSFTGEPISYEALMSLLEAARWAPSAYNAQPWRFIYSLRETPSWEPIFNSLTPSNQSWVKNGSALIVLASDTEMLMPGKSEKSPNRWHSFDSGAAWASIAFQATLSGYSVHALAGFDQDTLRNAVKIPDHFSIEAVIVVGKKGAKEILSADLQVREAPNQRHQVELSCSEGTWTK